jgi:hypothetical protein
MNVMGPRPDAPAPRKLACGRCGTGFDCGLDGAHCWCAAEPLRRPMPSPGFAAAEDCLCPTCLRAAAAAAAQDIH